MESLNAKSFLLSLVQSQDHGTISAVFAVGGPLQMGCGEDNYDQSSAVSVTDQFWD